MRIAYDATSYPVEVEGDGPDSYTRDIGNSTQVFHLEPGSDFTTTADFVPDLLQGLITLRPNSSAAAFHGLHILQRDGSGAWQVLWSGDVTQAGGQARVAPQVGANGEAVDVRDTQTVYNAFGERTERVVDGQQDAYW